MQKQFMANFAKYSLLRVPSEKYFTIPPEKI